MTPLVDPGTDCEDELPDPADIQSVPNQMIDGELQSVFMDVASLPTMITPVSDVDRAWCAPEYVDAVIAPPAVLPVVIRAPAAATSAVSNVLLQIRSLVVVGMMSEIGTPLVNAVSEALLDAAFADVGLVASNVLPYIASGSRERDHLIRITTGRAHLRLHNCYRRLRGACFA